MFPRTLRSHQHSFPSGGALFTHFTHTNGNHFGDARSPDNGKHNGGGSGGGKFNNEGKGKHVCVGCNPV